MWVVNIIQTIISLTLHFKVREPPKSQGAWLTIHPSTSTNDKYYGTSLSADSAPPTSSNFNFDTLVTLCFSARKKVEKHKGFVAEVFDHVHVHSSTDTELEYPTTMPTTGT